MEIQVRTQRRRADDNEPCKKCRSASCCAKTCEVTRSNFLRTYGLSVKIKPANRSYSLPPPERRKVDCSKMDGDKAVKDVERDSAIGNSHNSTHNSSESITLSLDLTPGTKDTNSEDTHGRKSDLFDQLVLHFGKRDDIVRSPGRGRAKNRPQSNRSTARRSLGSRDSHSLLFGSASFRHESSAERSPRPKLRSSLVKHHSAVYRSSSIDCPKFRDTSTPDSTFVSSFDQSRASSLGLSRIRTLSTSSFECQTTERSRYVSDSAEVVDGSTYRSSLKFLVATTKTRLNDSDDVSVASDDVKDKRKSAPSFLEPTFNKMMRSQYRRAVTPDFTLNRDIGRSKWYGADARAKSGSDADLIGRGHLEAPASGRASLERVTADTIDRRRMRKPPSDKFGERIYSATLASAPPRSTSAMGDPMTRTDAWANYTKGRSLPASPVPVSFYLDKNGRVRQARDPQKPIPSDWLGPDRNITICSVDSSTSDSQSALSVDTVSETNRVTASPERIRVTSPAAKKRLESADSELYVRPSPLDVALSEDHNAINQLAELEEEEFTMKLISAMKELKDIAEVARIIDEVDDEEWLLVFVGELDHRLQYLMKAHEEESEPDDHEANTREKATILDVALDLVAFLKERSAYRLHRRQSLVENIDGVDNESDVFPNVADGATTIQRMKKIAEMKPHNPYEMQKWQRQLMNLAGTLDKYLSVLQKGKEVVLSDQQQAPSASNAAVMGVSKPNPERRYFDALSDYSTLSSGDERLRSADQSYDPKTETSSGVSLASDADTNRVGALRHVFEGGNEKRAAISPAILARNANNNNNNNNNNSNGPKLSSSSERRIPVLDLRSAGPSPSIFNYISTAAHIHDKTAELSPNCLENERFLDDVFPGDGKHRKRHPGQDSQPRSSNSLPASARSSPTKHVVSAYCRLPNDPRKRSASVSNDRDLRRGGRRRHVAEVRVDVDPTRGRASETKANPQRSRSYDALDDDEDSAPVPATRQSLRYQSTAAPVLTSQRRPPGGGARPKVRPPPAIPDAGQSSRSRPRRRGPNSLSDGSSSSAESARERHRYVPPMTSSAAQCDLDAGWRQREKIAEQKLDTMKRRADALQTGLDDAKQDRDEKERKIAVLQARLDRMKKNLAFGESEKGAVEEEMDNLKKLLEEKTEDSEAEITMLKRRIEDLERMLEKEKKKYERMEETVDSLKQDLQAAQRKSRDIEQSKEELEQQIHDLTLALMHERQHSHQVQSENARLEQELEDAGNKLEENSAAAEKAKAELQTANDDLARKLEHQRYLADEAAAEKLAAEENATELRGDLQAAEAKIGELTEENERLGKENRELVDALTSEQMMLKDLANCYGDQVEYLNHELKISQDAKDAQTEAYEEEVARILAEKGGDQSEEIQKAKEEAEKERTRADALQEANDGLRDKLEEGEPTSSTEGATVGTSTTQDQSVQVDDRSYMQMRAFDWYSGEARRNARQLDERGRQLEKEARAKLARAHDAMRGVNELIATKGPFYWSTPPKYPGPNQRSPVTPR